jgi:hypothetical protein
LRTGATLLITADLDEMVTQNLPGYVRFAMQLAGDPDKLVILRQNRRGRLRGSKACCTFAFAGPMEKPYREIREK